MSDPVRYTSETEQPAPREDELTAEILELMAATQTANADRHRHAARDAHAKSHAVLRATVTVHDDLPPELAQGIFATPRTYDAVVRLSSSPGDIHSDTVPAPRGFALKVIGVDGERLLPELGGRNQDFLMVNFPVLAFGTIARYRQLLPILEQNSTAPDVVQRAVAGVARAAAAGVEATGREPGATLVGIGRDNDHVLGETYHSQGAVRFGDHIAKVSVAPASREVQALTGTPMRVSDFSSIQEIVLEHFRRSGAQYTLRAQLCTDLDAMPVEDASVRWDDGVSPHRPVATVRIEAQDAGTPERRVYGDDVLSFNPWDGVLEHQPLGQIMRIRKPAYERSTAFRHGVNVVRRAEPSSLTDIPD